MPDLDLTPASVEPVRALAARVAAIPAEQLSDADRLALYRAQLALATVARAHGIDPSPAAGA